MAKVRRDIWKCDAPGCDVEILADSEPPRGYSGKVSTEGGTGCYNQEFFSCNEKHIEPAIREVARAAQERAWAR